MNKLNIEIDSLPTLPTVYQSILQKMDDPKTNAKDLANLIILDQSSTVKLLQLVNSSIFSFKTRIKTISQAISFLGFNEVRNTIYTLAVTDFIKGIKQGSTSNIVLLWKHSIATGVISKIIGKEIGLENYEQLFIAGLLHDFGKLIFFSKDYNGYMDIYNSSISGNLNLLELEKEKFGMDHCELGYYLSLKWNLSDTISNSIKFHHTIDFCNSNVRFIACVYLANIIGNFVILDINDKYFLPQPNPEIWKLFNLKEGFLRDSYMEIITQYFESINILKL